MLGFGDLEYKLHGWYSVVFHPCLNFNIPSIMILVLSFNLSRKSIHTDTQSVHLKTYRHMPYTDPRYRHWLRLSDFGAWNLIPKSIIPEVQYGLYPWCSVDTFYMTSPNGNIFLTKASGAECWCFLWSTPWINCWVNIFEAGDWNSIVHYDIIVMALQIHLSDKYQGITHVEYWASLLCLLYATTELFPSRFVPSR